ncbi:MAG TPA: tyrosine-type recombinase/integrase [Solirubrobacteraceae bacterium]|jgi:site-specific recombinase XerD|nr:tyrosine-type recombinase/integrase [Solirubrobacteraceae bacterium]
MHTQLALESRRRSPATLPGFRKGQRPVNYGRKFPGEVYEPEEVLALLDAIPATTAGTRDRALFVTLWRTGMRISEALNLRELDLHESTGYVRIRRGRKNERGRDVMMFGSGDSPTFGWDQLHPWLIKRAELDVLKSAPLFCTFSGPSQGGKLKDAQMRNTLHRYVQRAGLHGRFHLHGFRHTLAAELYRGDVKLTRIKHQLGHSSLAVTQTYLEDVLGIPEAMDELSQYQPTWRLSSSS